MPDMRKGVASSDNLTDLLAMAGRVGLKPELQKKLEAYVEADITRRLKEWEEDQTRQEANKKAGIELAKAFSDGQTYKQTRCNHEKPRGLGTRFIVMALSNGQKCFMCQRCQKQYFAPPRKELAQEAPPRELVTKIEWENAGGALV